MDIPNSTHKFHFIQFNKKKMFFPKNCVKVFVEKKQMTKLSQLKNYFVK